MEDSVRQKVLRLPVGVDRQTRRTMSLGEALGNWSALASRSEMSLQERLHVVRERWEAGDWLDAFFGTEGLVDLPRAIRELEGQSDLGMRLQEVSERSIDMSVEDSRGGRLP